MATCGQAVICVATVSEQATIIHGGAWCDSRLYSWCGDEEVDSSGWNLRSTFIEICRVLNS